MRHIPTQKVPFGQEGVNCKKKFHVMWAVGIFKKCLLTHSAAAIVVAVVVVF